LNAASAREGPWLLLLLALFWGVNWPAMKLAVADFGPFAFRVLCVYTGALGLFAIARKLRLPLRVPPGLGVKLAIGGVLNVSIWQASSAFGLMHVEAGRAALIAFTMPIWVGLFGALFLGATIGPRLLAGLGFGTLGFGFLAYPAFAGLGTSPLGLGLMLAAAIGWAVGTLYVKRQAFAMPAVTLTAWQLAFGGVPLIVGCLVFEFPSGLVSAGGVSQAGLIGALYATTVPMVFCHWAWFRVLEILPAQIAALGVLAVPAVGVASSAWLTGERFAPLDYAGMIAIMAALFMALTDPPAVSRDRP